MINQIDFKKNFSWFVFALLALSISGFYSIFVSMMRIPFIYKIFHYPDFFKTSLIIHVTLSINVFFILFVFFNWAEELKTKVSEKIDINLILKISSFLGFVSISLISVSGFIPGSSAITINYIPIINNLYFLFGIGIFFGNLLFFSILYFYIALFSKINLIFKDLKIHLNFFIFLGVIIGFVCIMAYMIQIKLLNSSFDLEEFFWGFGHILQFVFIELATLCVFINLKENSNFLKNHEAFESSNFLKILSFLKLIILIISPFFYFSDNHLELFTFQMKYALPLFLVPINLYFLINLIKNKMILKNINSYIILSFIFSVLLGIFGGKIGYFIKEINVTVPAHYHGSLISLTIIVMSFFYSIIEKNLINKYSKTIKYLINSQLILYFFGHFCHISGLLLMGGYGALRKNPGNISSLNSESISLKIGKYIFFSGSLMSIIGGMIFIFLGVYLVLRLYKNSKLVT